MVLGVSKQIQEGRVALFELERFEVFEGKVRLTPHPFGRTSTASFELVEYDPSAKKAVFENMKHDFPQRLTYAHTSPDRLEIRLVGVIKGKSAGAKASLRLVSRNPTN
jgi:hypothetical protein